MFYNCDYNIHNYITIIKDLQQSSHKHSNKVNIHICTNLNVRVVETRLYNYKCNITFIYITIIVYIVMHNTTGVRK